MRNLIVTDHQGRISPLFDTATLARVVEICDGEEISRRDVALRSTGPTRRAEELALLGTGIVLCGAISRPFRQTLVSYGFEVIGFLCGQVEEIITAFRTDSFIAAEFSMPGCKGNLDNCGCRQGARTPNRNRQRHSRGHNTQMQTSDLESNPLGFPMLCQNCGNIQTQTEVDTLGPFRCRKCGEPLTAPIFTNKKKWR